MDVGHKKDLLKHLFTIVWMEIGVVANRYTITKLNCERYSAMD